MQQLSHSASVGKREYLPTKASKVRHNPGVPVGNTVWGIPSPWTGFVSHPDSECAKKLGDQTGLNPLIALRLRRVIIATWNRSEEERTELSRRRSSLQDSLVVAKPSDGVFESQLLGECQAMRLCVQQALNSVARSL